MKSVQHRVADKRILRLIQNWLKAGVSEDGEWPETEVGTPQGAVISPLLANVYLHYVFDLWVEAWREKVAVGDVITVRYADDLVVGFQHRAEAERLLKELEERLAKSGLELHPGKKRLIGFGRFAQASRQQRGEGEPESFTFLGFTHRCGRNSRGHFTIWRQTARNRLEAKLQEVKQTLRARMHEHAVPGNWASLHRFRGRIGRNWRHGLERRSQKSRLPANRVTRLLQRWLPRPRLHHPYPDVRFDARYPRQEPYAATPLVRICTGRGQ